MKSEGFQQCLRQSRGHLHALEYVGCDCMRVEQQVKIWESAYKNGSPFGRPRKADVKLRLALWRKLLFVPWTRMSNPGDLVKLNPNLLT